MRTVKNVSFKWRRIRYSWKCDLSPASVQRSLFVLFGYFFTHDSFTYTGMCEFAQDAIVEKIITFTWVFTRLTYIFHLRLHSAQIRIPAFTSKMVRKKVTKNGRQMWVIRCYSAHIYTIVEIRSTRNVSIERHFLWCVLSKQQNFPQKIISFRMYSHI